MSPGHAASRTEGVAIVVVNYGAHALVERNLTRSLTDFAGMVVVVDNFFSQVEQDAMGAICRRRGWTFVASPTNSGYGGGNNQGAEVAVRLGATELLLLNPDAYISSNDLGALAKYVRHRPMSLVAPVVLRPDGSHYSSATDLHLATGEMLNRSKRPADVLAADVHTWLSGACLMLTAQLWTTVGGFDEDFFLYWEDVDLSHRVALAGGTVEVLETCTAVHDEGSTHSTMVSARAKSPIYYYYNVRNRLLYATKHLPRKTQVRWARSAPRVAYQILLQGGRRQLINPRKTFWPALRGVLDGRKFIRAARNKRSSGREQT